MNTEETTKKLIHAHGLDERLALCTQWKESNLSKAQFCRSHGINATAFYKWSTQLLPKSTKSRKVLLTPVRVMADKIKDKHEEQVMLELSLPNHVLVRVGLSIAEVSRVIGELCDATTTLR